MCQDDDRADEYELLGQKRQAEAKQRRQRAAEEFPDLVELAAQHGLTLVKRSESHYQLLPVGARWLLNIYPGNCRLYHDPNIERSPFLHLPTPWTLRDVLEAAIKALEKTQ